MQRRARMVIWLCLGILCGWGKKGYAETSGSGLSLSDYYLKWVTGTEYHWNFKGSLKGQTEGQLEVTSWRFSTSETQFLGLSTQENNPYNKEDVEETVQPVYFPTLDIRERDVINADISMDFLFSQRMAWTESLFLMPYAEIGVWRGTIALDYQELSSSDDTVVVGRESYESGFGLSGTIGFDSIFYRGNSWKFFGFGYYSYAFAGADVVYAAHYNVQDIYVGPSGTYNDTTALEWDEVLGSLNGNYAEVDGANNAGQSPPIESDIEGVSTVNGNLSKREWVLGIGVAKEFRGYRDPLWFVASLWYSGVHYKADISYDASQTEAHLLTDAGQSYGYELEVESTIERKWDLELDLPVIASFGVNTMIKDKVGVHVECELLGRYGVSGSITYRF